MKLLNEQQIEQFVIDYKIKSGDDLDAILGSDDKTVAFVNRVYNIVIDKVKSYQPEFKIDEASDYQLNTIWAATLEQAYYMRNVGDFYLMSGYDPVTGQVTPKAELDKRAFSAYARDILGNAGMLYRGIRKGRSSAYLEERSYWGRMR